MSAAFNRRSLRRIFLLPEDADDARIATAIRRQARRFRGLGRPFVLPAGLDLAGCFAALDARREEELDLALQINAEIEARKRKLRDLDVRVLCLDLIRDAGHRPENADA